jgi:methanogenic corrinoid protein MtbC1
VYTIHRAAELTGVGEATLRAWERRYGVLTPARSPGRYRLYDEASLDTIRAMRSLIESGWAAGQAAAEVKRGWRPGPDVARATRRGRTEGARMAEAVLREPQDRAAGTPLGIRPASADQPAALDAGALAPPDDDARFGGLRKAAADLDARALSAILDDRFNRWPFEAVVDDWLMPALVAIGDDWATGRLSVAGEHFAANAVQRRLATAYEAAYRVTSGPRLIAGLPPGAAHDLGIFAFTVAARRAGLATTYLGANVPVDDWVVAVGGDPSAFVALAAPRRQDLKGLGSVVRALVAEYPGVRIGVGGRYQHLAPAPAEPLGHRIGPVADRLAQELARLAPV